MINKQKFALTFGVFAAVMHAIWALVVGLGLGQSFMDFVYQMHFMQNPYSVSAFSFTRAVGLVALAFFVAYVVSSIFATIWNRFHK